MVTSKRPLTRFLEIFVSNLVYTLTLILVFDMYFFINTKNKLFKKTFFHPIFLYDCLIATSVGHSYHFGKPKWASNTGQAYV